jgi:hypothetical protein
MIGLSVSGVCADADVPQIAPAKIAAANTPRRLVMIAPAANPQHERDGGASNTRILLSCRAYRVRRGP